MVGRIHPLAQALNETLQAEGCSLYSFLSTRGVHAYFPWKGILGQSAAARGSEINATIGTALEEDGGPLCLDCLTNLTKLPSSAFLYAPSWGNPTLRQIWREMMIRKNPSLADKDFSTPVVTHALTHGLYVAANLFLDPDDSVIIPDLYWDNYELLFQEARGAKFNFFPMFENGKFNVCGLTSRLAEPGEKKVILLNFPNNPTGYTATVDDAEQIKKTVLEAANAGKKVLVLLDDAYFGLIYEEGVLRESMFSSFADLHENVLAVKLDGSTKEDYVWGVRIGFITFASKGATPEQYKALEAKASGLVRGTVSCCTNIGQQLLLKAYQSPEYPQQKKEKFDTLCRRYHEIRRIFAAHPEYRESFEPMPFNSGYFMCVKPIGVEAEDVRLCLLQNYSTGVIVLSGLIRLAFSSVPFGKLEKLFHNIDRAIRELKA